MLFLAFLMASLHLFGSPSSVFLLTELNCLGGAAWNIVTWYVALPVKYRFSSQRVASPAMSAKWQPTSNSGHSQDGKSSEASPAEHSDDKSSDEYPNGWPPAAKRIPNVVPPRMRVTRSGLSDPSSSHRDSLPAARQTPRARKRYEVPKPINPPAERAGPPQKVARYTMAPTPEIPGTIQVCLKCRLVVPAHRAVCDVCSETLYKYMSQPRAFELRIKCEVHPEAALVSLE